MTEYQQKLRDPRWQKKRLQILERDNWTCQKCEDTETTLMVHHRLYRPETDPWDYADSELVVLCESCHNTEWAKWSEAEGVLIAGVRTKLWTEDAIGLGYHIARMKTDFSIETIMLLIWWLLQDNSAQEILKKAYDERFKNGELPETVKNSIYENRVLKSRMMNCSKY